MRMMKDITGISKRFQLTSLFTLPASWLKVPPVTPSSCRWFFSHSLIPSQPLFADGMVKSYSWRTEHEAEKEDTSYEKERFDRFLNQVEAENQVILRLGRIELRIEREEKKC
ncbi:predicted protein [Arabidopsis lyrata subsp. lyrata]|uniref:Predicted protein n=1 Tax=Arabidopsis lyrata subsp. lyrata TaxID=81972 RepID=D7KYB5_ARALL|nr:predicted protein [Arabidopsis lyrata subsp. lyrata]